MQTVNKNNVLKRVKQELKHEDNCEITLLTFKKDRSVAISKNHNNFKIIENGFSHQILQLTDENQAFKVLKKMIAVEFPRSNTIYLLKKDTN